MVKWVTLLEDKGESTIIDGLLFEYYDSEAPLYEVYYLNKPVGGKRVKKKTPWTESILEKPRQYRYLHNPFATPESRIAKQWDKQITAAIDSRRIGFWTFSQQSDARYARIKQYKIRMCSSHSPTNNNALPDISFEVHVDKKTSKAVIYVVGKLIDEDRRGQYITIERALFLIASL